MYTETWEPAPTQAEIVDYCLRMKPDVAAVKADSSLCVTPLITRMMVDGQEISLELKDDKWFAFNVRVSRDRQRSGLARQKPSGGSKDSGQKDMGFSEEEQLHRCIRHCIQNRLAFKIYSDAGITGEYPNNDPALIERLLKKKAARYKRIFSKVLLDESSLSRRSPEQIAAMRKYMEDRCAAILRAGISEDDAYKTPASEEEIRVLRLRRGRPRKRVYHRQGFSQIWLDVADKAAHTVAACDSSRICRDADLEMAFLQHLAENGTSILGLVESTLELDVADPMNRGVLYLLASQRESKLVETATTTFRGSVQRLESGRHTGRLPWWIKADQNGYPQLVPDSVRIVQKILDLYLSGQGPRRIGTQLIADNDTVDGKHLTDRQIAEVFDGDTIAGHLGMYGLEWPVLPAAITDENLLAELGSARAARSGALPNMAPKNWAEHLFTGLLRCATCGSSMQYQAAYKDRPSGSEGTYRCLERHGEAKGSHATIDAIKLEDFISELVAANPGVLNGALASALCPGSSEERTARRALLESTLRDTEVKFAETETAARGKAALTADGLGLTLGSEAYHQVMEGLVKNEMAQACQELDAMRDEIARLRVETSRKSRDEKLLSSLSALQDWDGLDVPTKNRLLRSVFEEITIFPRKAENKIELKLHGLSEPLAPIYPRHTNRESVRLPSVAEWLEDTYSPTGGRQARPLSVNSMRYLSEARQDVAHVEGAKELFEFCRQHKIRTNIKAALKSYQQKLLAKGADARLMTILEEVYEAFVEIERIRLAPEETSPTE